MRIQRVFFATQKSMAAIFEISNQFHTSHYALFHWESIKYNIKHEHLAAILLNQGLVHQRKDNEGNSHYFVLLLLLYYLFNCYCLPDLTIGIVKQ